MSRKFSALTRYPSMAWNIFLCRVLRIRNWWDEIDSGVFLGAKPFAHDVRRLHALGVRFIVNMCQEYPGHTRDYARLNILQLHLPTVEYTSPSPSQLRQAVDFIANHRRAGHVIYIHCKSGKRRGATVALCWLMQQYGLNAKGAFDRLAKKRKQVSTELDTQPVVCDFWTRFVHRRDAET